MKITSLQTMDMYNKIMDNVNDLLTTGNITTIVVWIVNILLPYTVAYGIDKDVLTSIIITLVWFGFTVFSSANPNTFDFLGNKIKEVKDNIEEKPTGEDMVLNEEYTVEVPVEEDEGC